MCFFCVFFDCDVVWFGLVELFQNGTSPSLLLPSLPLSHIITQTIPPSNPKTQTVYTEKCRSWYKLNNQEQGPVVGLWPGSCLHALRALAHPRWEDFEYVYLGPELESGEGSEVEEGTGEEEREGKKEKEGSKNRLYWLGNGMTWCEEKMEGDRKYLFFHSLFCLFVH